MYYNVFEEKVSRRRFKEMREAAQKWIDPNVAIEKVIVYRGNNVQRGDIASSHQVPVILGRDDRLVARSWNDKG
jgi:hypothetical protein